MLQKLPETLTWFFKDPKFASILLKFSLLILSCIFILPMIYVIPVMIGYQLRVIRHLQGNLFELPEIDAEMWTEGLMYLVVVGGVSTVIAAIIVGVPMFLTAIMGATDTSEATYFIMTMLTLVVQNIVPLVLSAWGFYAMSIYARTRNIGDVFSIQEYQNMWTINQWNMVIGFVLSLVIPNFVLGVGFMLLCIGILPAMMVSSLMTASLIGSIEY